ncbi:metal-dependent hydrolase [Paenibacillus cremeus]|uniref:Metal-dependent hydrolase n=1 Tax=Paenibacillus cremeus TaxID=2163881 RepID=A0A559KDE6_9BACL|nr:metal-dependent hydrolase [Paenibacillus cremeus]TVY10129.1 metal-dependent hydrolase [Paenibacillus cremeus]
MDTGSHLLFGASLAGLALLCPAIGQEPVLAHAVLTASIIGSHAPDFDTVARLKGMSAYLRIHRGLTHSLPALMVWPFLIALPVAQGFHVWHAWPLLLLWTFAAVFFHVLLDWFNAYGVQCFRPITRQWCHLDFLALFEPLLFVIHAIGIVLWVFTDFAPGTVFATIYAATFVYIGLRFLHHRSVLQRISHVLKLEGSYQALANMHWFRWQFVVETKDLYYTGKVIGKEIVVEDVYSKGMPCSVVQATLSTDGVRAFLAFAQRIHVCYKEKQDGYVVEWRDVRFRHNHKLPFGVDVTLDRNLNVVDQ